MLVNKSTDMKDVFQDYIWCKQREESRKEFVYKILSLNFWFFILSNLINISHYKN